MRKLTILYALLMSFATHSQDKTLPYYEIPDEPSEFTAGTVAARLIDGLGFRYYWATEGLRPEDLSFRPTEEARSTQETLSHIHELSAIIANSTRKIPTQSVNGSADLSFTDMRKKTLENLKISSDILRSASDKELNDFRIIFIRQSGTRAFPFWNQINGPISDALWHVGQVVTFRRSSGNPISEKANVLTGKVSP